MSHENPYKVREIAPDYITVYESPDPAKIYTYSPGICVLPSGRWLATMDLSGPGMDRLPGPKRIIEGGTQWFGKVFTSDDRGRTWVHRTDFPFMHARPFAAGGRVYVLGHCNDLMIMCSEDEGNTWSAAVQLSEGQIWHQSASNVHFAKGNVYLAMERITRPDLKGWPPQSMAPVLMRGKTDSDLMRRENWTFASELVFLDAIPEEQLNYFGIPFYHVEPSHVTLTAPGRHCARMGWLETNVVQIVDPSHYFYDPTGRTFHLWMRAHTGGTGYAAVAKAVENEDGTISTMLETVPSGRIIALVPCPGGQMKFHILYDEKTALFWLLSTQATDSMTRAELLPPDRFNLPNNERQRLQLHFSKNCIDWCFAGLVAKGDSQNQARHYASMAIAGDDLLVLSRSGDERASCAHNGNLISLHHIRNFRDLAY